MKTQSIRRTPVLASIISLIALLAAAAASPAGAEIFKQAPLGAEQRKGPVPDRYIVVLKDSVERPGRVAERHSENRDAQVKQVYRHALKGYAAKISKGELAALKADPTVANVERDYYGGIASQSTPTGIDRVFATANESLAINEEDDVRVDANIAIIDTGVAEHPDLDLVSHVNCSGQPCAAGGTDGHGHGTHVAGTAGAIDNDFGVVGVAPGARLWGVKVVTDEGQGHLSEFIAGIDWVTATREDEDPENDIDVANSSLRYWEVEESKAFEQAIEASMDAGVVHVAAAGNESENVRYVPGNHPDVITVSALEDFDGEPNEGADPLAGFSNYGPLIDVAAPGVSILSTIPWGLGYQGGLDWSGTSMASPHVAGAAAILAAGEKPESAEDVEAIRDTIVEEGNFDWTDTSGDGIKEPLLDVSNEAVFQLPLRPTTTTLAATEVTATSATLNATVDTHGLTTIYAFQYGTSEEYGEWTPGKSLEPGSEPIEVNETIEGLETGTTYHFRIYAVSSAGVSHGEDLQFTPTGPPSAATEAASLVMHEGATLNAKVNPNGLPTTYQFEWGETAEYGNKAPATPKGIGSGKEAVEVDEEIESLEPGITYHFRVVATNNEGTSFGEDRQFTASEYAFGFAFGGKGSGNGQFTHPIGIAVDPEGDIWVADSQDDRIQRFNPEGEYLSQFGEEGSADGQFNIPTAIALDSEGDIWVTDAFNHRVQQFNPEGEYLSQFGENGSGDGEFSVPFGIALDSEGDIWVTDSANNRVQQFSPEGEYLSSFGEQGSGGGQFNGPRGIAIDPEGSIWVTDSANHRVQQFSPEGEYLSSFGEEGSSDGQFNQPIGIALDSEGDIWVTDAFNNRVQQFNPDGDYLSQFGEQGSGEGQFLGTRGIAVDSGGALWIADGNNSRVQKWVKVLNPPIATTDAASEVTHQAATLNATVNPRGLPTTYQFEWGETTEYGSKAPATPKGIGSGKEAVEVDEGLEGLEPGATYHFRVVAESADGKAYGEDMQFTTARAPEATTEAATAIAEQELEEEGEGLFEAVLNAKVNPNGLPTTYQFEWGETTEYGNKAPITPKGIGSGKEAVGVNRAIFNLEPGATYHFRVVATNVAGTAYGEDLQFSTPGGEYIFSSAFGEEGSGDGQFQAPAYAAVDSEGDVWVTDHENHRVQQFNPEGEYLSQFGEQGSASGLLDRPFGIAIDSEGDIWVGDTENHRVQQFSPEGEYLSSFGEEGNGEGQFEFPTGIAIDAEGAIWVADSKNHRVQQFSPEGEYLSSFGEQGSGGGQFNGPRGIAIDSEGSIWVTDAGNNRVQQFSPEGEYLSSFGEKGSGEGEVHFPIDVAIDSEGDLLVTELGNSRVQQFSPEGEYLSSFGEQGSGEGQFLWIWGLAVDAEDTAWVVDTSHDRVQRWVLE